METGELPTGEALLGDHPIHPVLLSTDLAETRRFYHDQIGLEILSEGEDAIVFACGRGTNLSVTKSTTGTADTQTQAGWAVSDVRAEVAELSSRGVKVEDFDMPGLKTEDGIADIGLHGWRGSSILARTHLPSCRSSSRNSVVCEAHVCEGAVTWKQ